MPGPSGADQFWQLFLLPAGASRWTLQTPPDIATNGALILAGQDQGPGQEIIAGERPSLSLTFSAITTTRDGGRTWATLPPASGLAAPDGHLIALGGNQQVTTTAPGGGWTTLTTLHALAATPAARSCALTGLTAAAYTPAGSPLPGGTCGRADTAGIFGYAAGTWRQAGPPLPAALASQQVRVLRLARTDTGDIALLGAGTGTSASLLAAWVRHQGQWRLSPALRLSGAQPVSASFGSGGAAAVLCPGTGPRPWPAPETPGGCFPRCRPGASPWPCPSQEPPTRWPPPAAP
jgi:hypothetical protein